MEKDKFTPGPWKIAGGNENERTDVIKIGPGYVSHIAHLHDQWICDEHGGSAFANARLIAAAPAGLKAAQMAYLHLLKTPHDAQGVLCALRNFIADAKGLSIEEVQNDIEVILCETKN